MSPRSQKRKRARPSCMTRRCTPGSSRGSGVVPATRADERSVGISASCVPPHQNEQANEATESSSAAPMATTRSSEVMPASASSCQNSSTEATLHEPFPDGSPASETEKPSARRSRLSDSTRSSSVSSTEARRRPCGLPTAHLSSWATFATLPCPTYACMDPERRVTHCFSWVISSSLIAAPSPRAACPSRGRPARTSCSSHRS